MTELWHILAVFALAAAPSALLCRVVITLRIVDAPTEARKLQKAPVPTAGGLAVALSAVLAFGFAYMCIIVLLTLVLSFSGLDIVTAFSAVVASVNNTGPGLNLVGPATTYEILTDFQTWVCTFAMLLGRLELFTLLVVMTPAFWRK